ncbi:DNA polymerase III subunit [Methylorubrum thiocyanatum]|uniref:DNA polymerase III subunit n=1 Tax=Methylorubrum thiocyanatum TaxID=47958 RepID=UPI0036610C95
MPERFTDLVGQEHAVKLLTGHVAEVLRGQVAEPRGAAFLLYGPYGSGKTSLARITAKALLCTGRRISVHAEPHELSPCNRCPDCVEATLTFVEPRDHHPRLSYCDCGSHGSVEWIRTIITRSRYQPPRADQRRVVVLDEAHSLSPAGFHALHQVLQDRPAHLTAILITTDRDRIASAVRSRCHAVRTDLLDAPTAEAYARAVCRERNLAYDGDALGVLVDYARGHARDLVNAISAVGEEGRISLEAVRRHFPLGDALKLAGYLDAVLDNDLGGQLRALDGWVAEPAVKLLALHRLLVSVFVNDVMGVHRPDRTMTDLPAVRRLAIRAGFTRRAEALGLSETAFWERIIAYWTIAPGQLGEPALMERVLRFGSHVVWPAAPPVPNVGAPVPAPRRARRSARAATPDGGDAGYLSKDEARRIWDAGSFLVREYGLALNARVRFEHARLRGARQNEGVELARQFLHELGLALTRWERPRPSQPTGETAPLHWICVHEVDRDGGLVTQIAAHIPLHRRRDVELWLRGSFLPTKCGPAPDFGAVRLRHYGEPAKHGRDGTHETRTRAHRRHTNLLRLLCRGLDPSLVGRDAQDRRRPLVELIGIRPGIRRPAGRLDHGRRVGTSRSIAAGQQEAEALRGLTALSPFEAEAWAFLGSGWERAEYVDRLRWRSEAIRRDAVAAEDRRGAASPMCEVAETVDCSAVSQFQFDARLMRRTWVTWEQSRVPLLYRCGDGSLDPVEAGRSTAY